MVYLLGAAVLYVNGSGKQRLSRLMPRADAEDIHLAVTEVRVSGIGFKEDVGVDFPIADYNLLDLDCTMETVPFDLVPDGEVDEFDRYVQVLPDQPAIQYLNLPGSGMNLKYRTAGGAPDGISIPYNVGFPFVKNRVMRKWHRVPKKTLDPGSPLMNRLVGTPGPGGTLPYLNSVNKTDFMGYKAGTLVLVGYSPEVFYDPVAEDWMLNITYSWDLLVNNANYLYYFAGSGGGTSGWYLASRGAYSTTPGDTDILFPLREHRDIFVVGDL
jgi:hypothetical protein